MVPWGLWTDTVGSVAPEPDVPVGSMVMWPNGAAIPPRWLLCNGASFQSLSYTELATVLGGTATLPNVSVAGVQVIIRAIP